MSPSASRREGGSEPPARTSGVRGQQPACSGEGCLCGAVILQVVSGEGRSMRWWSPPEDNVAQAGVLGALPPSLGVTHVADGLVLLLFD